MKMKKMICTENYAYELFIEDFNDLLNGSRFVLMGNTRTWRGQCCGGDVLKRAQDIFKYLKDCDVFEVYEVNEHLYVQGVHHDGYIEFEIKILNKRGEEYYSRNYDDMSFKRVQSLFNNYSVLPHYSKRVFGY